MLTVTLADKSGLKWAQEQVLQHHYLLTPVDARCSPVAMLVKLFDRPVGCLIFEFCSDPSPISRCFAEDIEYGVYSRHRHPSIKFHQPIEKSADPHQKPMVARIPLSFLRSQR